jgi:glycine cleavage system transcriptional repressor
MPDEPLIAVTAIGNDRPGIVAGVTKTLYDVGCNLEDATSTILRGHFAMTLVVRAPGGTSASDLERALAGTADELDLIVAARAVDETAHDVPQPTHVVSVYGADRPGIVYRATDLLAKAGANITDLASRVIGSDDQPVYALLLEVVIDDAAPVERSLKELGAELGIDISVHPVETDLL